MITLTGNKGIHLKFDNGITLSIQFGLGNYCSNLNADMKLSLGNRVESADAEIAAFNDSNLWFNFSTLTFLEPPNVKGYVSFNEVLDYITYFRNYKTGNSIHYLNLGK